MVGTLQMRPKYVDVTNISDRRRPVRDVGLSGGLLELDPGESFGIPRPVWIRIQRRTKSWLRRTELVPVKVRNKSSRRRAVYEPTLPGGKLLLAAGASATIPQAAWQAVCERTKGWLTEETEEQKK